MRDKGRDFSQNLLKYAKISHLKKGQKMNHPQAIGPYSIWRKAGKLVFFSGQIPLDPNTGELISDDIKAQATQALKNVGGALNAAGLSYENVIKSTIFLTDINDFGAVNEIYASFFTEPYPARSAVGIKALPKGAKIEIEVIARK